jgi:hypothetical protein
MEEVEPKERFQTDGKIDARKAARGCWEELAQKKLPSKKTVKQRQPNAEKVISNLSWPAL